MDVFVQRSTRVSTSVVVKGKLVTCFFAYPVAINLQHQCAHSILMEVTFKTNSCGMPLLHRVGPTSVYTSLSVSFVFLRSEDTESYNWTQKRVAELFQPTQRHATPCATNPITFYSRLR